MNIKKNKKTITIDEDIWADLLRLKADLKVRTHSEVLQKLIKKWKTNSSVTGG
jgi:predicted CopG family antitoxin